jgi:hypothetical protein
VSVRTVQEPVNVSNEQNPPKLELGRREAGVNTVTTHSRK